MHVFSAIQVQKMEKQHLAFLVDQLSRLLAFPHLYQDEEKVIRKFRSKRRFPIISPQSKRVIYHLTCKQLVKQILRIIQQIDKSETLSDKLSDHREILNGATKKLLEFMGQKSDQVELRLEISKLCKILPMEKAVSGTCFPFFVS